MKWHQENIGNLINNLENLDFVTGKAGENIIWENVSVVCNRFRRNTRNLAGFGVKRSSKISPLSVE